MFIKESPSYTKVKKNIPMHTKTKIVLYILDSLSTFITAYTMVFVQKMIDAITIDSIMDKDVFLTFFFLSIGITLLSLVFGYISELIGFFFGMKFTQNVLTFLFKSFYKQDFLFPKRNDSGEVASKLLNDSGTVTDWLASGDLSFWGLTTSALIKFAILFSYSPQIAIAIILVLSTCFASTRKINKIIAEYGKKQSAVTAELTQFFMQATRSFVDVKQLGKENVFIDKMVSLLKDKLFYYQIKEYWWSLLYGAVFMISSKLFPFAVLLSGIYMTYKGEFTIGKTMAVYTLMNMTQGPLNGIAGNLSSCKSTMILSERLDCFLEEHEDEGYEELQGFDKLEFDCGSFSYTEDKPVLRNLKFEIDKGDIFCIKGRTGSGKSTIASLLMRFNTLYDGVIKLNGENIRSYTNESFYKRFNMLNQVPFIFQDSIEQNITLGEKYSEEFLNEVLEVAQLKDFIEEYGMDYILDEDAKNISGGQKQRIGLARILIRKPQFLLLDEPTAALDENTAKNLVVSLKHFAEKYGITIAVITHSSVFEDYADKMLNLNDYIQEA